MTTEGKWFLVVWAENDQIHWQRCPGYCVESWFKDQRITPWADTAQPGEKTAVTHTVHPDPVGNDGEKRRDVPAILFRIPTPD